MLIYLQSHRVIVTNITFCLQLCALLVALVGKKEKTTKIPMDSYLKKLFRSIKHALPTINMPLIHWLSGCWIFSHVSMCIQKRIKRYSAFYLTARLKLFHGTVSLHEKQTNE